MVVWDAASTVDRPDALRFSAAETAEPNLGCIVENLRVQWALHESPLLRGVTAVRSSLAGLELDAMRRASRCWRTAAAWRAVSSSAPTAVNRSRGSSPASVVPAGTTARRRSSRICSPKSRTGRLPGSASCLMGRSRSCRCSDGRVSLVWTTRPGAAAALLAASEAEFSERVSIASDHVLGKARWPAVAPGSRSRCGMRGLTCSRGSRWSATPRTRSIRWRGRASTWASSIARASCRCWPMRCARAKNFTDCALRRYERWRRSENAVVLAACDTLNRLFTEKSVAVAGLRRFGMAVVSSQPLLRRSLIERALGAGGDAPQLARRTAYTELILAGRAACGASPCK
jgi:2-polyprenylphenol 6-hydroxylase